MYRDNYYTSTYVVSTTVFWFQQGMKAYYIERKRV